MAEKEERFLARWSRLKGERAAEPAEVVKPAAGAPRSEAPAAPVLPPVDSLTPESDFSVFMNPKVADALRRVALKKLFRHPEIDVPDPYEPFSGDWTGGESIPEDMLKTLYQARRSMFRDAERPADEPPPGEREEASEPEASAPERIDDAGKQDT